MSREIFDLWVEAINSDEPICLVTVIEGEGLGAKMLVRPGKPPVGTLGHGSRLGAAACVTMAHKDNNARTT
jgi:hypothetical protein